MSEETTAPESVLPSTPPPSQAPVYSKEQKDKKLISGLLGIFLGGLGVHKFYLGYTKEGVIQLVVTVITCGFGSILGLIEGILYLTKTDDEFVSTYVVGRKPWF